MILRNIPHTCCPLLLWSTGGSFLVNTAEKKNNSVHLTAEAVVEDDQFLCPVTVALTSILMKHFEKWVLQHIKNNIPTDLDPHQFGFRANRSTEDAISAALHSVFTHHENNNTYISSAFNTISPMKLIGKRSTLGLSTTLYNWILDFLTDYLFYLYYIFISEVAKSNNRWSMSWSSSAGWSNSSDFMRQ